MIANKPKIFFWYGENDYEIQQKIKNWIEIFEKKYSALNISNFDLAENSSQKQFYNDLKNSIQVDSLFGLNKLIILKNFLSTKTKSNQEIIDLIIGTLQKVSDNFCLIFVEQGVPDKRTILYKNLFKPSKEKKVEIKEFKLPEGKALITWIVAQAKKENVIISPESINLLSALVGNDLWQLDLEIQKLINYKKNEKITTEDINLLVKGKYNDDIFQLMDAISNKDKTKALKLFQDQLDSGANEIYLLTMLIRQFRIFWQIAELNQTKSLTPDQVASELKIHPYVIKKSSYYLRHFTLEQIKQIYKKLLTFEIKLKTTGQKFELMFDLLIADL